MGDYINENDLILSDDLMAYISGSTDSTKPNRNLISKSILYAEGRIKASLGLGYTLPLEDAQETELVRTITKDLTIWRIYVEADDLIIPEKRQLAYDEAKADLLALKEQRLKLGLDSDDETDLNTPPTTRYLRS
jgi:hypothetical protein